MVQQFHLKINIYLPYDAQNPFLAISSREIKNCGHPKTFKPSIHNCSNLGNTIWSGAGEGGKVLAI